MKLTWVTQELPAGSKLEEMVAKLGVEVIGTGGGPANK